MWYELSNLLDLMLTISVRVIPEQVQQAILQSSVNPIHLSIAAVRSSKYHARVVGIQTKESAPKSDTQVELESWVPENSKKDEDDLAFPANF